ncbi:26S proteasome non-ATPase regulatory subunit [Klebsormidium nitens]|uniref:26S proteasome non-ATPase regulatory subunit 4 homolog n=1 Tax=Klebsormidium nitens TaxID=105231 RepID=A0A1Y1ILW8_KLENI|nr:26S proteasome non-ATPase regulatory subunit [Klebsormidium nitens]|eukprot:GAQ89627.1 26S proteasome non-ATPase regulatory subunit [Klebsormidium nitens]
MVLEATVICLDNSEWMRNGDYSPSRFQAQADAVNLICGAKTQSNPENTVGLLTMAGKGVRVVVTPTPDLGKILSSMHGLEIEGVTNVPSGVQIAQLALKHRQNKNQRQRIVLFAGSPVDADKESLVRIGKKLKKNNVAVDIVNFGEEDPSKLEKLEAFLGAVNSNDNSHLVTVPPGVNVLSDVLISSPVFTGDGEGGSGFAAAAAAGAAAAAAGVGGGDGFNYGVDPNLDPELALALRVSMEEERARQERAAKEAAEKGEGAAEQGESSVAAAGKDEAMTEAGKDAAAPKGDAPPPLVPADDEDEQMDEEQMLLQQALALSMADAGGSSDTAMADAGESMDAELAAALQMSVAQEAGSQQPGAEALADADFINSVLAGLPGVDPNDAAVREVLAGLGGAQEGAKKDEKDKEKKDGNGKDKH